MKFDILKFKRDTLGGMLLHLLLAIAALVLIAVLHSYATWRYWRATAPSGRRATDGTFVGHG